MVKLKKSLRLERDYEKRLPKIVQDLWVLQRNCFRCVAKWYASK